MVSTVRDVTAQKKAERELEKSNELFSNLARLVPGVVYQYRLYPDGHSAFPYSSPGMNDIYEYSPEEVQEDASPVFSRLHPDDYDMVSEAILESAKTLKEFFCEFRVILPRQGLRWRWSQAHPQRTDDGGTLWHGIISDITERKQAEEIVRINEARYKAISNLINDFAFSCLRDSQGEEFKVDWIAGAVERVLGYPDEYIQKQGCWKFAVYPQDVPIFDQNITRLRPGEKATFELRVISKSGDIKWLRCHVRVTTEEELPGKHRLLGGCEDITERIKAEETLRESEEKYRQLAENTESIPWEYDVNKDRWTYVAPQVERITGYSSEEWTDLKFWTDHIHEQDREWAALYCADCTKKGLAHTFEYRFVKKNGDIIWLRDIVTVEMKGAQPVKLRGIMFDITETKNSEEALKESEQKYRIVADYTDDWEYWLNNEGKFEYISPACERITGYTREEFINNPKLYMDIVHPEDHRRVASHLSSPDNCKDHGELEYRIIRKDGGERWLSHSCRKVQDADGNSLGRRAANTDITARKQMEEKLKNSAEEWATTFDAITDPISIMDTEGRLMQVNQAYARAFGQKPNKLMGRHCYEIAHGTDKPIADCPLPKTLENKEAVIAEINDLGKGRFTQVTTYPVFDAQGKVTSVIHITKDITDRKEAEINERQLREKAEMSSRLAAVGEMAAGIAHEINNPLTGVIGFSELLLGREDIPEDMKEELTIINAGSQRVKDIVRRMLTFARQSQPVKSATSITELLENTLELRSYVLRTSNIEVVKDYDPDLPWVTADAGQLQQVFLNIIVNAEYAMKKEHDKGVLKVKTEKLDDHIRVSITDDGSGMSEEIKAKLFQPFFTTKEPGEGTGLGLPLSFGIVQEHGGSIEVDSEEGKGTTFMIDLPITPIEDLDEWQVPVMEEPAKRNIKAARILVADDEPTVGALVKAVLTDEGHEVTDCRSPDEAFKKLEAASYDLVILDIRMPGMSGIELYEEIKKRWPEQAQKVLFLTGDTSDLVTREYLNTHQVPYMVKPFEKQELKDKVGEVLSAKEA